ncbi:MULTISPECIES: ferredoxin-type protein NapF [Providencia]|uniref:ferredoxin-type protein NapF n=1 Tax=Providencia TaxID=586 RepID=UPI0012B5BDBA|nr:MULTISPECIES: ferredoxin-type protein NapF [Providencia]MTC69840.1 ferredoxin-type protein NapF [Providencia sp. wls1914]QLR03955.1 ferredoxin-type protein NapF [Providencia rettgeri]
MVDITRRGVLTGAWRNAAPVIRPPWSGSEARFIEQCTRCSQCITSCETAILQPGPGGYPMVDFQRGECTFCYACAEACPEPIFLPQNTQPWNIKIAIGQHCLAYKSIECRRCEDSCEPQVIAFRPSLAGIYQPNIDMQGCTGCGACVAGCPVSAITMEHEDAQ